ncbi:putative RNA-binding protein 18 [Drosera capensis]
MDQHCMIDDEISKQRIYIGNVDHRISEAMLIKLFSPYGKIQSIDFLLHSRGPKRGEPRGFAFVEYGTKEEAKLAMDKMHGRLACGRPLVVRLSCDKGQDEPAINSSSKSISGAKNATTSITSSGQLSRSATIAAIKNKLRALEDEGVRSKKPKN